MLPKQTVRDALKDSDKQSGLACKTMNNEMEGSRSSDNRETEMLEHDGNYRAGTDNGVAGEFIDLAGERYYVIHNVDKIAPFFISVISDSDHWLFVSSTGGLTAGRVSPETALFPYVTVDKIHDNAVHTGSKTLLHVNLDGRHYEWEPFNMEHDGLYVINRHLYKNLLGNKLCFEEINHDLQLVFRYTLSLIHISEPTRQDTRSRMPSSA